MTVLGNTANSTSLRDLPQRAQRFILQSEARRLLPNNRVIHCLRTPASHGRGRVMVMYRPTSRRAYYRGLQTCGQIWICPVCGQKISDTRRAIWTEALSAEDSQLITNSSGKKRRIKTPRFGMVMLTFTIRHRGALSLNAVREQLAQVYGRFWGGSWAQDFHAKNATIGTLRSLETTHGVNGWHPHIHALLVTHYNGKNADELYDVPELRDRWSRMADRCGLYASPEIGLTLVPAGRKVIEYVNKFDEHVHLTAQDKQGVTEVTKQITKEGKVGHNTLTDLLARSFSGDGQSSLLWAHGVSAMFGAKHLVASRGLLRALQVGQEAVDDHLASVERAEAQDIVLAIISDDRWREIVRRNLVGNVLAIADYGDPEILEEFLAELPVGEIEKPNTLLEYGA